MVKVTLAEITSFSWELNLSQLKYFTENFWNYGSRTFTEKGRYHQYFIIKFLKMLSTAV